MAKLIITAKTKAPATNVQTDMRSIVVRVSNVPLNTTGSSGDKVAAVSVDAGNIIERRSDGIYAAVNKPDDILSFVSALDDAIN